MTNAEKDFLRCVHAIRIARQPLTLYLSPAGHPTPVEGVGGVRIGTYTKAVPIGQLEEDIKEAERERRGRVG